MMRALIAKLETPVVFPRSNVRLVSHTMASNHVLRLLSQKTSVSSSHCYQCEHILVQMYKQA